MSEEPFLAFGRCPWLVSIPGLPSAVAKSVVWPVNSFFSLMYCGFGSPGLVTCKRARDELCCLVKREGSSLTQKHSLWGASSLGTEAFVRSLCFHRQVTADEDFFRIAVPNLGSHSMFCLA